MLPTLFHNFQVPILTAIQGDWALVSHHNLEEFCRRSDARTQHVLLHTNALHFTIIDNNLYSIQNIGAELVKRHREDLASDTVFLEENKLVVVNKMPDQTEEEGRFEHSVKDGQLHVALKRHGVTYTRIFERIRK